MRWNDLAAHPVRTLAEWQATHAARLAGVALPAEGVAVLLEPAALLAAWQHVAPSALERGGLLLGTALYRDATGDALAAVHVRAAVAALDDAASALSLQMNTAVWDAARAELAAGEVVVGWFHSHPGLGAFFSGTDRRTQAGFFAQPFSLGWVIDPQRREQAWFAGADSSAVPSQAVLLLRAGGG